MSKLTSRLRLASMVMGINFGYMFLGYDTGIGGAVSALPSFRRDFGISPSNAPSTISNIVSILFGGAWFGALIFALLSHYIGRRKGLMVATVIFTVGAITQTACKGNLGQMYAGRFITGLGIGAVAEISPTFTAECSSPKWRGRAVAMVEMNLVAGGLLSYWITYATSLHIPPSSSSQWRIPIAIQLIFGGIAFFCTLPMNESPRWLISKGKDSAGLASLAYLRCTNLDDPALLNEFAEIKAQVKEEIEVAKGVTFRELMLPYNRKRLFISTFLGLWGIWTAHTALVVYAPTIFQQIGFSQATTSLLASGVFATLKFVVTIIAIALTVDRFGRVVSMCVGLISTGTIFFSLAAIQATHPPRAEGNISAASKAMMALIYLHVIIYSFTMGPMPWIYSSEIFPLRLREIGQMAFSVGTWTGLFTITKATPPAFNAIGWKTWLIFASINITGAPIVWFVCPETKGLTLEEMDIVFGSISTSQRAADIEGILRTDIAVKATTVPFASSAQADEARHGRDSGEKSTMIK